MKYLTAAVLLILLGLAFAKVSRNERADMHELPKVFLWGWERPEDLRFLPPGVGVAYLAARIRVIGDRVLAVPRMQPLMVAKETPLIPVCRVEVNEYEPKYLTEAVAQKVCDKVLRFGLTARACAVQIDFDARQDERPFYRMLLRDLRVQMPRNLPISITALMSWCLHDPWMRGMPFDEIVPMCFSMGPDAHNVLFEVQRNQPYVDSRCDRALGISVNEPDVNKIVLPVAFHRCSDLRVYLFSSRTWSRNSALRALRTVAAHSPGSDIIRHGNQDDSILPAAESTSVHSTKGTE